MLAMAGQVYLSRILKGKEITKVEVEHSGDHYPVRSDPDLETEMRN